MGDKNHKNLTNFLRFFINRPHHLAKYLLENEAIRSDFLLKLQKDSTYKELEEKMKTLYFTDVNKMNSFFDKLTNQNSYKDDSDENLVDKLDKELQNSISEERYEDAIRIRDYLKNLNEKKRMM